MKIICCKFSVDIYSRIRKSLWLSSYNKLISFLILQKEDLHLAAGDGVTEYDEII